MYVAVSLVELSFAWMLAGLSFAWMCLDLPVISVL